jgi:hypothetical protein
MESEERESRGISEDEPAGGIGGQGGEGREQAETTPDIGVEGEHGQTTVPAPGDDAEEQADDLSGVDEDE